jgi:hypothetical protein
MVAKIQQHTIVLPSEKRSLVDVILHQMLTQQ